MTQISGVVQLRWTVDLEELNKSYEATKEYMSVVERSDLTPTLEEHLKELVVCSTPGNCVDVFMNGENQQPVCVRFDNDTDDVEIKDGL